MWDHMIAVVQCNATFQTIYKLFFSQLSLLSSREAQKVVRRLHNKRLPMENKISIKCFTADFNAGISYAIQMR